MSVRVMDISEAGRWLVDYAEKGQRLEAEVARLVNAMTAAQEERLALLDRLDAEARRADAVEATVRAAREDRAEVLDDLASLREQADSARLACAAAEGKARRAEDRLSIAEAQVETLLEANRRLEETVARGNRFVEAESKRMGALVDEVARLKAGRGPVKAAVGEGAERKCWTCYYRDALASVAPCGTCYERSGYLRWLPRRQTPTAAPGATQTAPSDLAGVAEREAAHKAAGAPECTFPRAP